MAQVIQLKDGSLHTVLGEQDILSLVEEKLGMEVRQVLEEFLFEHSEDAEYIADLEKRGRGKEAALHISDGSASGAVRDHSRADRTRRD